MAAKKAVTRRFVQTGSTKRFRKYQITEEMEDTMRENDVPEKEVRGVTGTQYVSLDDLNAEELYVTYSTTAPKGFVDKSVEADE